MFDPIPGCEPCCTCLLGIATQRASYVCQLKHNVEMLKNDKNTLTATKRYVRGSVIAAERGGRMRRTDVVDDWRKKVEAAENEVDVLVIGSTQCCLKLWVGCCCSDCIPRYNIGERVFRQLGIMAGLIQEGRGIIREGVAAQVEAIPVELLPLEQGLLRRGQLFDSIMNYLRGTAVGIIGLIGMAGVGKTTLLEQINHALADDIRGFEVVIWVDVLRGPHVQEEIQKSIARRIDLFDESWENKNAKVRGTSIFNVLRNKKFVLLLDDMWESIELPRLGVPLPERKKATSKIVFATQLETVCAKMKAHRSIKVQCLTYEEAWQVFQSTLEEDTRALTLENSVIRRFADTLVRKCDGLPLALNVVGHAMSATTRIEYWRDAQRLSQSSPQGNQVMVDDVFRRMQVGYTNLVGEMKKSCFLYCSLFSKGYRIPKRDLIDYWIGEGLLNAGAEFECIELFRALCGARLLEEDKDGDHVKLHGVIREMALWIATEKEEHERFFVATEDGLSEVPQAQRWERVQRMSVMGNQIKNLAQSPNCPHLLTLFLNDNNLQTINGGFFRNMRLLKVLNLSKNRNLAVLPEETANLISLENLDLSWTGILELPNGLVALKKLKCLNLENTCKLHTIPFGLIPSFSMLQVLRMLNCGSNQPTERSILYDNGRYLIIELLRLRSLEMLSVNFTCLESFLKFLRSDVLLKSTQSLCLQFLLGLEPINFSVADMEKLETLLISDCRDLEELRMDCGGRIERLVPCYFYSLKVVTITSCSRLRDLTWLALAPSLKRLVVSHCSQLVEIVSVQKLREFDRISEIPILYSLERLELRELPNLTNIHEEPLPFPELEEIKVDGCLELKKLPLALSNERKGKLVIRAHETWWRQLGLEDQVLENAIRFEKLA